MVLANSRGRMGHGMSRRVGGGSQARQDRRPLEVFVAASFPIVQVDENGEPKIRRGEDWRRSGNNSTVAADDIPTHHFIGDFVDIARRFAGLGVGIFAPVCTRNRRCRRREAKAALTFEGGGVAGAACAAT